MSMYPQANYTLEEEHELGFIDDQEFHEEQAQAKQIEREELGRDWTPSLDFSDALYIDLTINYK